MFKLLKTSKRASAKSQIDIKSVRDDVLVLPGNKYRAIIEVSSVNFELMSENEQDALIDTYESFLNSIRSPFQILLRTRTIDLDKYLAELERRYETEDHLIYKEQLKSYCEFVKQLIVNNRILARRFYIVIPFNSPGLVDFDLIKDQLSQKADLFIKGLSRLGISARTLSSLEILDLFYSFFSPERSKLQPLSLQALNLINTDYVHANRSYYDS